MQPMAKTLVEFNMASMVIRGEVTLVVRIGGVENPTVFDVLDGDMDYNVLLGRS